MNYPNARKDLKDTLESFLNIPDVNRNRDTLIEYGKDTLGLIKVVDVINGDLPLDMLQDSDLYYLTQACYSLYKSYASDIPFNDELLKVEKYFDIREIDTITSNFEMPTQIDSDTYVFHDVTKVDDMQYMIPRMTEEEIIRLIYGGFVKYDRKLQRESEKVTRNGVSYERVKVYAKSKREIKESMKDGSYRPTALSINILNRNDNSVEMADLPEELLETHFYYDEQERTLTISKKDRISLIDGMHRLYALMECYSEQTPKEPFKQLMQMNVFFMTAKQAKRYIYQEGQKNPISKEQLQKLNSSNIYTEIAEQICNMGDKNDNLLIGKIGTDYQDISIMDKFTTIGKMIEALTDNFDIDVSDKRDIRLLVTYIIRFFNELFSIYKNDVNDIKRSRNNSVIMSPNMIYAYIRIAKHLRGVKNWEDELDEILDNVDFSLDGAFKDIAVKYDLSKKNKNIIYDNVDKIFL